MFWDFFKNLIEHIFIEHLLCTPDTDPDAGGTDTAEDKQKPQPLQSSWSLHSCEIKARKLIHGENDKLWAKEQFLWRATKWVPIVDVRKKQWSPYGVTQNHRALLSSLTQAWESEDSESPLYHNIRVKVNAQCFPGGPQDHLRTYLQTRGKQWLCRFVSIKTIVSQIWNSMKMNITAGNKKSKKNHETKIAYSIITNGNIEKNFA